MRGHRGCWRVLSTVAAAAGRALARCKAVHLPGTAAASWEPTRPPERVTHGAAEQPHHLCLHLLQPPAAHQATVGFREPHRQLQQGRGGEGSTSTAEAARNGCCVPPEGHLPPSSHSIHTPPRPAAIPRQPTSPVHQPAAMKPSTAAQQRWPNQGVSQSQGEERAQAASNSTASYCWDGGRGGMAGKEGRAHRTEKKAS